jgi:ParB-like chromosome segregation protein Spo0J
MCVQSGIFSEFFFDVLIYCGQFEILSGHNCVEAAKEAGLTEVPAVVREGLTDEEALFIVKGESAGEIEATVAEALRAYLAR